MFYSRTDAACSYLAILGKQKIDIYFIQDDEQGCETQLEWRIEYQFDKETRALGKITSLDFGEGSLSFATGSNVGNVGIWNIAERQLEWTIRILHPKTKSAENISMVRALHREQVLITYSLKSQSLLVTQDKNRHHRIKNPETTQLRFDPAVKGDVMDLSTDPANAWIAATFENGSITIYSRLLLAAVHEVAPHHIHTKNLGQQVVMDQYFSYLCYIDENKKAVHFETLEWQYNIQKLEKVVFEAAEKKGEVAERDRASSVNRVQSMKEIQAAATQGFR
jgi:hypothetical protein